MNLKREVNKPSTAGYVMCICGHDAAYLLVGDSEYLACTLLCLFLYLAK